MSVYIDTSVWFAAANIRDKDNARAKTLLKDVPSRLTSDHVLVETWLLLQRRIHYAAAESFWAGIRRGAADIVRGISTDFDTALGITKIFSDQKFLNRRSDELRCDGAARPRPRGELRRGLRDLPLRPQPRPGLRGSALSMPAAPDLSAIRPGLTGSAELVVAPEHTAPRVGSGEIAVLATPVMINLIEAAALAACEQLLPAGYQSLGTHLDIKHTAATPVGLRVVAAAEVVAVEGRTIAFRVEAHDERETIGGGTHARVVINVARFDRRVQSKLGGPAR